MSASATQGSHNNNAHAPVISANYIPTQKRQLYAMYLDASLNIS